MKDLRDLCGYCDLKEKFNQLKQLDRIEYLLRLDVVERGFDLMRYFSTQWVWSIFLAITFFLYFPFSILPSGFLDLPIEVSLMGLRIVWGFLIVLYLGIILSNRRSKRKTIKKLNERFGLE